MPRFSCKIKRSTVDNDGVGDRSCESTKDININFKNQSLKGTAYLCIHVVAIKIVWLNFVDGVNPNLDIKIYQCYSL